MGLFSLGQKKDQPDYVVAQATDPSAPANIVNDPAVGGMQSSSTQVMPTDQTTGQSAAPDSSAPPVIQQYASQMPQHTPEDIVAAHQAGSGFAAMMQKKDDGSAGSPQDGPASSPQIGSAPSTTPQTDDSSMSQGSTSTTQADSTAPQVASVEDQLAKLQSSGALNLDLPPSSQPTPSAPASNPSDTDSQNTPAPTTDEQKPAPTGLPSAPIQSLDQNEPSPSSPDTEDHPLDTPKMPESPMSTTPTPTDQASSAPDAPGQELPSPVLDNTKVVNLLDTMQSHLDELRSLLGQSEDVEQ